MSTPPESQPPAPDTAAGTPPPSAAASSAAAPPPSPSFAPPPGATPTPPVAPSGGARAAIGWALLAVAFIALLLAYVLPTLGTIATSVTSADMFGDGEPVGGENYATALGDTAFIEGGVLAAVIALWTVGGVAVAFLVAWCVHLAGRGVRAAARVTAALTAVAFAPAAWTVALVAAEVQHWADPGAAEPHVADWASWIKPAVGVAFGIGLLVGLAAFRGGTGTGRRARTVLTAAGLTAFAAAAVGLQAFSFSSITGVQPTSPLHQVFSTAFRNGASGLAAAMSVLLLIPLALLGVGAAILFITARVRIDVAPGPDEPRPFRAGPGIGALVLIALTAAGALTGLRPWLTRLTEGPTERFDAAAVIADTWGSALVTTVVALACAVAGGIAIGALRPLGDASRWLLLPFAPWLLVGTGPLALAHFEAVREAEQYGTFLALAPRAWIAVPALFLFTALFWGVEDRRRAAAAAGPAARGALVRDAWPVAALIALAVLVANAQDSYWQAVAAPGDHVSAWAAMASGLAEFAATGEQSGVAVGYPPALLVPFALAAAAAAVWALPKTAVRVGR